MQLVLPINTYFLAARLKIWWLMHCLPSIDLSTTLFLWLNPEKTTVTAWSLSSLLIRLKCPHISVVKALHPIHWLIHNSLSTVRSRKTNLTARSMPSLLIRLNCPYISVVNVLSGGIELSVLPIAKLIRGLQSPLPYSNSMKNLIPFLDQRCGPLSQGHPSHLRSTSALQCSIDNAVRIIIIVCKKSLFAWGWLLFFAARLKI
jgi:hypothetical protein